MNLFVYRFMYDITDHACPPVPAAVRRVPSAGQDGGVDDLILHVMTLREPQLSVSMTTAQHCGSRAKQRMSFQRFWVYELTNATSAVKMHRFCAQVFIYETSDAVFLSHVCVLKDSLHFFYSVTKDFA